MKLALLSGKRVLSGRSSRWRRRRLVMPRFGTVFLPTLVCSSVCSSIPLSSPSAVADAARRPELPRPLQGRQMIPVRVTLLIGGVVGEALALWGDYDGARR